jgi:hypothetical protein
MKTLACQLEGYLELRHKLGFKLRLAGGLLRRFVRFAQRKKASVITRQLALEWATQPQAVCLDQARRRNLRKGEPL